MADNQMPHNLDAEVALLGCILLDEEIQSELLGTLKEEEFYQESHRFILAAMHKLFAVSQAIDLVTLTDQLERDGTLKRAGGVRALTELSDTVPSAANYKDYLEIVRRDYINRSLIRASSAIIENCKKKVEKREAIAYAEKLIYDISKQEDRSTLEGLQDGKAIDEVVSKFTMLQTNPDANKGVLTGFKHLDRLTNGLQKSDLIILAARPGMGKTSFAMNIVENACLNNGKTAAVFSLEMPRIQIVQRLLCAHAGVSMGDALLGHLRQKDWKNLLRASEKLQSSNIYIDDSSITTPQEILSKCRRLSAQTGHLDLVMIDYIQLMEGGGKYNNSENRQQEIASITRNLKIMAKELDVPVIALSQLRRIQTQEPQLSDLRESGAIEQDADIVMFINRKDYKATAEEQANGGVVKGATELIIAKHRNGEQGRIQLRFIGERTKFVDVEDQGLPEEEPHYTHAKKTFDNPSAKEVFPSSDDTGIPEE